MPDLKRQAEEMHPIPRHLETLGAQLSNQHSIEEIRATTTALGVSLPDEFVGYFTSFRGCSIEEALWEFFDLAACAERTELYRQHYPHIRVSESTIPSSHLFAFCDALIDAPTYFVISHPNNPRFGSIIGALGDQGWLVGNGLSDFLSSFKRDWKCAILENGK